MTARGGIALIPETGIVQTAPDPYGSGTIATSRYFVKVSDNNGDASEIAAMQRTIPSPTGTESSSCARSESQEPFRILPDRFFGATLWLVFEARFKRLSTWALGPAFVVLGPQAGADFSGTFEISGGSNPGIGTIDTASGDLVFPELTIRVAAGAGGGITGGGESTPSIRDITEQVRSNPDQRLLLSPEFLGDFIQPGSGDGGQFLRGKPVLAGRRRT